MSFKIVLIPDSFKGTMSSKKVCILMEKAILNHFPQAEIVKIPIADGGEGTVDCILSAKGGQRIDIVVKDPYMDDVVASYGIIDDGKTAVIEMAACAGLSLVKARLNPSLTTTFGVGQLIADAVSRNVKKIILGIGGSCTNDMGAGAAAALGVRFLDSRGLEFVPVGGTLDLVCEVDTSGMILKQKGVTITAICDVENPLCGKDGASYIYGPQKGADPDMVRMLDEKVRNLAEVVEKAIGRKVSDIKGAGAAGGLGCGVVAFLDGSLKPGIELILDMVNFDELARDADLIFTGEGKVDLQSLCGKTIAGIARRTKVLTVPLIVVAGDLSGDMEELYKMGVSAAFSTNRLAVPFNIAETTCEEDLSKTMDTIMRILKLERIGFYHEQI